MPRGEPVATSGPTAPKRACTPCGRERLRPRLQCPRRDGLAPLASSRKCESLRIRRLRVVSRDALSRSLRPARNAGQLDAGRLPLESPVGGSSGHSSNALMFCPSGRRKSAVVVAVTGVRVMQVPGGEVVDVIAMRDRFVAATCAVDMALGVTSAAVRGRAGGRIGRANLEDALVHVAIVAVVDMAIVEVVDVVATTDGEVAAGGAVDVNVIRMGSVLHDVDPRRMGSLLRSAQCARARLRSSRGRPATPLQLPCPAVLSRAPARSSCPSAGVRNG